MQETFYQLADFLTSKLEGDEVLTMLYAGEDSDFVRFNKSKIRQAGAVKQSSVSLELILGRRHVTASTTLTQDTEQDRAQTLSILQDLRSKLPELPEDPHLLYATEVCSSEEHGENTLPSASEVTDEILTAGQGHDLVGIYAAGGIFEGFANSLGQRNWFSNYNFNFDWSNYLVADKAVKSGYAGTSWNSADFQVKVDAAAKQLKALARDSISIDPGRYRVYLAPAAVFDFLGMLGWGAFGLKDQRTKQTALLKMLEDGASLHPMIHMTENHADGVAPRFQSKGFRKPAEVKLLEAGKLAECLISPRSAKEFDQPTNGANASEAPESMDLRAGDIPQAEVLERLGTGVYINNLWYLNFSDRPSCRITGMTRFACFWVENGEIVAPLNVMRFDETIYRAFGSNLLGLTQEREMILDAGTYGCRGTESGRMPGALVADFNFNL